MNKKAAEEWLVKAWHNLSGAELFYNANHYTDTTAVELHYAVEKILKSFLAYENRKINKTHDLVELYVYIAECITFSDDELNLLKDISNYHIDESYPSIQVFLPPKEEIQEALTFTMKLFQRVCNILEIDHNSVKNSNL